MNASTASGEPRADAVALVARIRDAGCTIACAESLTGGALTSALVDVPGASNVLNGGVVAYATAIKHSVLGVSAARLASHGPVDAVVAAEMALGVRTALAVENRHASIGVATTGVAGPEWQGGFAPGTGFIAVSFGDGAPVVERFAFSGSRAEVRSQCVHAAISLVSAALDTGEVPAE